MDRGVPTFQSHPMLPNGHWQTIVGRYLPSSEGRFESRDVDLELEDGDRLRVMDTVTAGWRPGTPAAVLVHGLAGDARSPYVVRMAERLLKTGVRVVRMNLRGAGEGFGLAKKTYHAGLTGDVRRVAEWLANEAPGSPIALVGFSLGANLVLKLAAEAASDPVEGLDCVLAANAPLDLLACSRNMRSPRRRIYDRNFVRALKAEIRRLHERLPELGPVDLSRVETLYDFDESYTAPRHGFAGAEEYYARSSAGPMLTQVVVPGLVVHAEDDPFIPVDSYRGLQFPASLALELIPSGGHLGYISRTRWDGDHRWLEARLSRWLADRWGAIRPTREGGQHHAHSSSHAE